MLKYSSFYPPVDESGIKGTAVAATRNVNRGAWATATSYNKGDIFSFNGRNYTVHTPHTSSGTEPDLTKATLFVAASHSTEIRYKRSLATPAAPTVADPSDWFISAPSGDDQTLWQTSALKNAGGGLESAWAAPIALIYAKRGDYNSSATYYLNNEVTYNGGTYKALQNNFTNQPPSGDANANAYWSVVAAPGAQGTPATPPSAFNATLTVPAGSAVNLRTLANAAGYTGASNATVTFNCADVCRGTAGAGIGIDTGVWPHTTYTIALTLNMNSGGIADGGGGNGGAGGTFGESAGQAGSNGGDAIFVRVPITINNNTGAAIRGGSGGFTGGPGLYDRSTALYDFYTGGSGGNGGFPNGSGGPGGLGVRYDKEGAFNAYTGEDGSAGSAGTTGGTPAANNSATAGYAIRRNGHTVTYNANGGTIAGTNA